MLFVVDIYFLNDYSEYYFMSGFTGLIHVPGFIVHNSSVHIVSQKKFRFVILQKSYYIM